MTAASTTADALATPAASAPSLKKRLRRAEMRKKLLYGALILPLAVFLLVAFVWPIASLLTRSVDNPEVHENLPFTLRELKVWDGKDLPTAAAFSALAEELESAKGSPAIAEIAKRLNREETGYRSLIMKTARKLPLPADASSQTALIDIDARWGEAEIWQAIRRSGSATTPFYLLILFIMGSSMMYSCKPKNSGNAVSGDAAARAYVAPGQYDEFYNNRVKALKEKDDRYELIKS